MVLPLQPAIKDYPPVLTITYSGNWEEGIAIDNPEFKFFIESAQEYIDIQLTELNQTKSGEMRYEYSDW